MPLNPTNQALVSYLEHERSPVAVIAPDHTLLAVNTAYRRQFGVADRDCIGRKCFEVSHGLDAPCDELGRVCPMREAASSRAPATALHAITPEAGRARAEQSVLDIELRPILDQSHAISAYVERLVPRVVRDRQGVPTGPVGRSPAFQAAMSAVQRVAPSMLPVLLLGESGTGKELFARAVHEASERRQGPFVVVDCSGLTESLFESELFGYEKGAFTGALARKTGLVEAAQGGTLFLDEIGDVPLSMQVKLLRLIESGMFRRVGGLEQLQADFRLVCATHQPLAVMVQDGRFRQDLYFRISTFPVRLPSLRERLEDLPEIARALLQRTRGSLATRHEPITPAALDLLAQYDWPGNVRELRNVLDRASLYSAGEPIEPTHLLQGGLPVTSPSSVQQASLTRSPRAAEVASKPPGPESAGPEPGGLATAASDEAAALATWVRQWQGSRADLARHLGMSERTLYRRLREAGLARALRAQHISMPPSTSSD